MNITYCNPPPSQGEKSHYQLVTLIYTEMIYFTVCFSLYVLLSQVAKHLASQNQIDLNQSWRIGFRSGKKDRRRTNLKTHQIKLVTNLLTPSHWVSLHCSCSPLLCYHRHLVDTLSYQELIGVNRRRQLKCTCDEETCHIPCKLHLSLTPLGTSIENKELGPTGYGEIVSKQGSIHC